MRPWHHSSSRYDKPAQPCPPQACSVCQPGRTGGVCSECLVFLKRLPQKVEPVLHRPAWLSADLLSRVLG